MSSRGPSSSGQVVQDGGSSTSIDFSSFNSNNGCLYGFPSNDTQFGDYRGDDMPIDSEPFHATPYSSEANELLAPQPPSRQEWVRQRPTIEDLYVNQGLSIKEVMKTMQHDHGFFASEKQYQTRFKTWQVRKNLNSSIMQKILQIKNWRKERLGKDSEFHVWNKLVPRQKITRFIKKYGNTPMGDRLAFCPTPSWMRCDTPGTAAPTPAESSADTQSTFSGPSTLRMADVVDSTLFGGSQNGMVLPVLNYQLATGTVLLGLRQYDLDDLAALPGAALANELPQIIGKIQRLAQLDPPRIGPYRRCNRCGFLPGPVDASTWSPATSFADMQSYMDLRDPSLVTILQIAIRHNEIDAVKSILRHCQHAKFTQRLHPSLLCMALHQGRNDLFRWLLLHGIGASADRSYASEDLLTQARMTLCYFITALVEPGGGESTDNAVGFLYRARVVTESVWRNKLIWMALRNRRPGVLRACLQQPNGPMLQVDDLMDKAHDIRKIIRDTRCSRAASVLVAVVEHMYTVSEHNVTALHLATALLLGDEVQRLLAAGADANAAMANGETPLHILSGLSDDGLSVARILLAARANVAVTDSVGDTPLHNALRHSWVHWRCTLLNRFRQAGASMHARNERGETPLITAALNAELRSAYAAMQWCLKNGACQQATDDAGNTAQVYYRGRVDDETQLRLQHDDFCAQPARNPLTMWESTPGFVEAWTVWPLQLQNPPAPSPRAQSLQLQYGSVYEDVRGPVPINGE